MSELAIIDSLLSSHERLRPEITFRRSSLSNPQDLFRNADWAIKLLWPSLLPSEQDSLVRWLEEAAKTVRELNTARWINRTRVGLEEEAATHKRASTREREEYEKLMLETDKILEDF